MTNEQAQAAMRKAIDEGRAFWCVTDQHGRPCNGGNTKERIKLFEWAHRIENGKICKWGYHATSEPWRWEGALVWFVEVDEVVDRLDDKVLCNTRRALGCVDPDVCIDVAVWVAASRPYLGGANLGGAYLGDWERGPDGYAREKQ